MSQLFPATRVPCATTVESTAHYCPNSTFLFHVALVKPGQPCHSAHLPSTWWGLLLTYLYRCWCFASYIACQLCSAGVNDVVLLLDFICMCVTPPADCLNLSAGNVFRTIISHWSRKAFRPDAQVSDAEACFCSSCVWPRHATCRHLGQLVFSFLATSQMLLPYLLLLWMWI